MPPKEREPAWNPRYVAYARSHSRNPEAQLAHDGGVMVEFTIWIGQQWRAFESATGQRGGGLVQGEAFDAWLNRQPQQTQEDR